MASSMSSDIFCASARMETSGSRREPAWQNRAELEMEGNSQTRRACKRMRTRRGNARCYHSPLGESPPSLLAGGCRGGRGGGGGAGT
jgi:hypothetical protein